MGRVKIVEGESGGRGKDRGIDRREIWLELGAI